jgi:hypothetical protein
MSWTIGVLRSAFIAGKSLRRDAKVFLAEFSLPTFATIARFRFCMVPITFARRAFAIVRDFPAGDVVAARKTPVTFARFVNHRLGIVNCMFAVSLDP